MTGEECEVAAESIYLPSFLSSHSPQSIVISIKMAALDDVFEFYIIYHTLHLGGWESKLSAPVTIMVIIMPVLSTAVVRNTKITESQTHCSMKET